MPYLLFLKIKDTSNLFKVYVENIKVYMSLLQLINMICTR